MSFFPGFAYKVHYPLMKPLPKEKYIICASDINKYLVFFISSGPRPHQQEESQIIVSPSELTFLSRNSIINTAEITICNPITCRVVADYGKIPSSLLDKICTAVDNSETLARRHIDKILKCLRK